ncbi:hypothetical protein RHD99_13795 [Buttiauxella selenatireducens]|uniref:Uncharacterized protein n=1 Tax=Buttiauxella selenatireducens TaxID=3073902 RepID=A0ABY9S4X6_9ENTR|nr:hypothetical protein [Buttiauxella sp. R73]WMY72554.1 hypothetical protein RHD99_13795 [Buttiauxella sp. R73]
MRSIVTVKCLLCFLLFVSFGGLTSNKYYMVKDIKNLDLYLWNGPDVKDRMLIGYNLMGAVDFNVTSGGICGGVGGGSSYLWIANVKSGEKKAIFPPAGVFSIGAPQDNAIVSTDDGHCVFSDGENVYSYSIKNPVTKVLFEDVHSQHSEKARRIFFSDENNKVVVLFEKSFSVFSSRLNRSKLIEAHFSKNSKYSLKSLGDFATLSNKGRVLYASAYIKDNEENVVSAILLIDSQNGLVSKILPLNSYGNYYNSKQFYVFGNGNKLVTQLQRDTKPAWYTLDPGASLSNDNNGYKFLFNDYKAGLEDMQLPHGDDYFYAVTTDKGELLKINLSGHVDVTSFDVKDELNRAVTVSHGEGSYPVVKPNSLQPKDGDTAQLLGDYFICKDLNNAPGEKNCGSARSGVRVLVQEVRKIGEIIFVKISPENDSVNVFWTVIDNLQLNNK